jgi:hypothetical protein
MEVGEQGLWEWAKRLAGTHLPLHMYCLWFPAEYLDEIVQLLSD